MENVFLKGKTILGALSVGLSLAAFGCLVIPGPLYRFFGLSLETSLQIFKAAGIISLFSLGVSLFSIVLPPWKRQSAWTNWSLLGLSLACFALSIDCYYRNSQEIVSNVDPLTVNVGFKDTFREVISISQALGWKIKRNEPHLGSVEAVNTSPWFGFKDDIFIKVSLVPDGTRVELHSAPRVRRKIEKFIRELYQRVGYWETTDSLQSVESSGNGGS